MGGIRVAAGAGPGRRRRNVLPLLGTLVLVTVSAACGSGHRSGFCGLVRTVNGFDPVEAVRGVGCGAASRTVAAVERGQRGRWNCSRAMHARYELDCRSPGAELQVLERAPVLAVRHHGEVSIANWTFRLSKRRIDAREDRSGWLDLGGPPFCEPNVPREALVALRLRPLTPSGGCFGLPRTIRR